MSRSIQPLHCLLTLLAGWINHRHLDAIEYLEEENRLLRERLGGRRLRFTDAERHRLARRAHAWGRRALNELDTLVKLGYADGWHRTLVAQKWTFAHKAPPNLGNDVSRGTIANVLSEHGTITIIAGFTRH